MRRLRSRLTFANVCSFLALTVALGTGGAYAANTIGSADVIDNSLLSADIKDGEVRSSDIGTSQILGSRIIDGTIKAADLADGGVTSTDLTDNGTLSKDIANGAVQSEDIKDDGVASEDVKDGSIRGQDAVRDDFLPAASSLQAEDVTDIFAGTTGASEVACPTGQKPTGGGYFVEDDNHAANADAHVSFNGPIDTDLNGVSDGWRVTVKNFNEELTVYLRAYAECTEYATAAALP